jgi:hypothetical protein
VPGVLFTTSSRHGGEDETTLQRIQYDLSGGVPFLPSASPLPQLALAPAADVSGPSYAVITLWVPHALESQAAAKLTYSGFTLD